MKIATTAGIIIVIAILLIGAGFYLDRTKTTDLFPLQKNKQVNLDDYGPAPEFTGISNWLNSEPLTLAQLRGKVVLIDFWTYSCINCVRTLPYVTSWYEKYKDQGFVVVGVHTPEFAFEKDTANVQTALNRHNINYPVAQDNDYATWRAYNNRYWPAHYLVNQAGEIVFVHFGEGKYEETENTIRHLLGLDTGVEMADPQKNESKTPEVYFGVQRLENLHSSQTPLATVNNFTLPANIPANTFALEGNWSFNSESADLHSNAGKIVLSFNAKNVFMVAESADTSQIKVLVDGEERRTVDITGSELYTLYESDVGGEHRLELQIEGAGLKAFTFTFG